MQKFFFTLSTYFRFVELASDTPSTFIHLKCLLLILITTLKNMKAEKSSPRIVSGLSLTTPCIMLFIFKS